MRDIAGILFAVGAIVAFWVVGIGGLVAATRVGELFSINPGATFLFLVVGLPLLFGLFTRRESPAVEARRNGRDLGAGPSGRRQSAGRAA